MTKPTIHLICNAHLDPVWQWRWEEGAAEAINTFGIAVRLLHEFPEFVFNHNEAILYRWVQEYDPVLFREIQNLVADGRWCIAGGWDLQPDVNMPGTEALIRHIAAGRRFFRQHFGAVPKVAYNFDSFGHSGGLPQILRRAGYEMYVHLRPGEKDLHLPADLYRWQGVDGSEIAAYRIPFVAYNTGHGGVAERISEASELALRLRRDTPVFWGLGDHGGGATRNELEQIRVLISSESRVEIIHSSTERFFEAVRSGLAHAPLHTGDLQRIFTGCYTSMSRLKRRMQRNLAELLQAEALRAASWWLNDQEYPADELDDAWCDHLFNDFHDILPGSSIEPAEQDALDLYGRSSETHRRLRLGAAAGVNTGRHLPLGIPLTVNNANPGATFVPVEVEYMIDHVPKVSGKWYPRLFTLDGLELPCQEEAPECLLLVDEWRRKLSFNASLPSVGMAHYRIDMAEGTREQAPAAPALSHTVNRSTGLVDRLEVDGVNLLGGEILSPLVVEDEADSWGMERWNYRNVVGRFEPSGKPPVTAETGPIRTILESEFRFGKSRILIRTIAYAAIPVLEFRLRIVWNEERKRLKLSFPTRLKGSSVFCEVPGGAISRPADGEEHVHGRWLILRGDVEGSERALALVTCGQHGFDLLDGELRVSILRSAPYCFERTYPIEKVVHPKVMDIGQHEVRLLLTAGPPNDVTSAVIGLADWLAAPPFAVVHYPIGEGNPPTRELLTIEPPGVRLLACKQTWDGKGLILRMQETAGIETNVRVSLRQPEAAIDASFSPFEIKTIRFSRKGELREVPMIEEADRVATE